MSELTPAAHVAYGINLGTADEPRVGPTDPEYGGLAEEWYAKHGLGQGDEDEAEDWDWASVVQAAIDKLTGFTEEAPERIRVDADNARGWDLHPDYQAWLDRRNTAVASYGITMDLAGSLKDEAGEPGLVLLVTETHRSTEWTEALPFSLDELQRMVRTASGAYPAYQWDRKLKELLTELGLELPDDNEPGWLLYPTYG